MDVIEVPLVCQSDPDCRACLHANQHGALGPTDRAHMFNDVAPVKVAMFQVHKYNPGGARSQFL